MCHAFLLSFTVYRQKQRDVIWCVYRPLYRTTRVKVNVFIYIFHCSVFFFLDDISQMGGTVHLQRAVYTVLNGKKLNINEMDDFTALIPITYMK